MIILKELAISFAGNPLFENASLSVNRGDKIGLIGRNGCGKSTLIKMILGKQEPDNGEVIIPAGYRVAHLDQHIKFTHKTILEEVCSVLAETYEEWKGQIILTGLGFSMEEMDKDPSEFSGGYQVKINLAKLLLEEPNMLLLDEPTNYLDIHSIRWLQKFLKTWDGEIMLITHDKYFMDSIINNTLHINRGGLTYTPGNSQATLDKLAVKEANYEKTRINEDKKRQKTEEWINRFKAKASMATRAQSKMKMLEKTEKKEKLSYVPTLDFKFNYLDHSPQSYLVEVNNVAFNYVEDEPLIEKLSFNISAGDKVCVIGRNGKGKSTLLKLITGDLKHTAGKVVVNEKVSIGYFGQMNVDRLDPNLSIYEELQKYVPDMSQMNVRKVCGNMMFSGATAKKPIKVLSGGEKSRVTLAKILLKPANMLLLDEPTNHLDMDSCESLMQAIKHFEGSVLMVTHDEYFLNEIANKLIIFDDGKTFLFDGGYDDFLTQIGWADEK